VVRKKEKVLLKDENQLYVAFSQRLGEVYVLKIPRWLHRKIEKVI
jgi:hypothetical protein